MSSKLFDRSRIIKINKNENDRDTHVNDNFWFDEITEESFYNDEYINQIKQPELKIIQNPNYYFLEPKDKSLDIKKTDIFNSRQYPSIDIIPYDGSSKSKLPEEIINMRRRSQTIHNNQVDELLKKVNKNTTTDDFGTDEDTLQNFSFSPDNELIDSNLMKIIKKKSSAEEGYGSDDKSNELRPSNRGNSLDISSIVKDLKREIVTEIKKDLASPKNENAKFKTTDYSFSKDNVVSDLTKRKEEKRRKKESLLKKKSVIELTREQLYSFEKGNKFKFTGNEKEIKEQIFKNVMSEPLKDIKDNEEIITIESTKQEGSITNDFTSFSETEEFKEIPLDETFKNNKNYEEQSSTEFFSEKTFENQSTEIQTIENQSTENQSTENQSTEIQTIENQSIENQSIENQSTEVLTIESKTVDNDTTSDVSVNLTNMFDLTPKKKKKELKKLEKANRKLEKQNKKRG